MLDHVGIPVNDLERSKAFYRQALVPLDYELIMEIEGHVGFGIADKPDFWFTQNKGDVKRLHVAFRAKDRTTVDAFYKAAISAGGRDNGLPGVRAIYHPSYYAAFVFDPDGNNIEAVCHEPE